MIIYKATNTVTGMSYIGQTIRTLDERRKCHERQDDKSYFQNAIAKYGKDEFEWEILYTASDVDELNRLEVHCIEAYNTIRPNGYNLTKGGEGSFWTGDNNPAKLDEVREKISNKLKGTIREDLSERNKSNTGKTYEDMFGEDKAYKLRVHKSRTQTGKRNSNYGNKMSENSKEKQRDKLCKYVYNLISPEGKHYSYRSIRTICSDLGLNRSSIMRVLKTGKKYKGWVITRLELT